MKDVKSTKWPMKVQDERSCRSYVIKDYSAQSPAGLGGEGLQDSEDKGRNSESQNKG